jgi:hypothetical protein
MPTKDLHNSIHPSRGLSPVKQTNADTAFVSEILDTAGYESAEFVILLGALTDTGVTFVVLVEDGDASNLSDNAAVADAFLLGTETTATFNQADDNEVRKIGYIGSKRYVRVIITPTGNSSGDINIAGCWLQGHARHQPTATLADD